MSDSSRVSRKVAVCVLILLCLGVGAWFFFPERAGNSLESVKTMARNLVDKGVTEDESADVRKAETASDVETSGKSGKSVEAKGGSQISAPLNAGERPAPLDPQAELLARVDEAMGKTSPAAPDGDSASGPVVDQPPASGDERRDSVVTPRFVSDMASWLAASYVPSHREDREGHTSVTLARVNARYSNSGTLRSVERDPLKSRSSILNYVFTPGMLEALYRMYAPAFMEDMERAAREGRRRHPLSEEQVADMFRVYADKFQRLAVSLNAAASVDLPALSAAVRREVEHEAVANESFARAYTSLTMARERGDRDEIAIQSRRMAESTRVAGMYAERQERARNDLAYAIRRNAEGKALSSSELLFLGEWLSRRQSSVEATRAAADVCRRMAERMEQRADVILRGGEAENGNLQNAASESSSAAAANKGEEAVSAPEVAAEPRPSVTDSARAESSSSATPSAAPSTGEGKSEAPAQDVKATKSDDGGGSSVPATSSSASSSSGASSSGKTLAFPEVSGSLNRGGDASPAAKSSSPAPDARSDVSAPQTQGNSVDAAAVPAADVPAGENAATDASGNVPSEQAPAKETERRASASSAENEGTAALKTSSSAMDSPAIAPASVSSDDSPVSSAQPSPEATPAPQPEQATMVQSAASLPQTVEGRGNEAVKPSTVPPVAAPPADAASAERQP